MHAHATYWHVHTDTGARMHTHSFLSGVHVSRSVCVGGREGGGSEGGREVGCSWQWIFAQAGEECVALIEAGVEICGDYNTSEHISRCLCLLFHPVLYSLSFLLLHDLYLTRSNPWRTNSHLRWTNSHLQWTNSHLRWAFAHILSVGPSQWANANELRLIR